MRTLRGRWFFPDGNVPIAVGRMNDDVVPCRKGNGMRRGMVRNRVLGSVNRSPTFAVEPASRFWVVALSFQRSRIW